MMLSDRDIKKYMKNGILKIEPMEDPDMQIQPSGIDLRLGNQFRTFKVVSTPFIDPKTPIEGYTELLEIDDSKPFILHPGEFALGTTKEYIKVPKDLVGIVDGRSSLGRLGISVHTTSAGISPGWEGFFTLEIANIGKMPVALYPGMRVCKLSLIKLSSEPEESYKEKKGSKYDKQTQLEESKIFQDFKWK